MKLSTFQRGPKLCPCGRRAVKLDWGKMPVCQRCDDIERRAASFIHQRIPKQEEVLEPYQCSLIIS